MGVSDTCQCASIASPAVQMSTAVHCHSHALDVVNASVEEVDAAD